MFASDAALTSFPAQNRHKTGTITLPMRLAAPLFCLSLLCLPFAAQEPAPAFPDLCKDPKSIQCGIPVADLKKAKKEFEKGLEEQQAGRAFEALKAFEQAALLNPKNFEYLSAREISKQQLVYQKIEDGNKALSRGDRDGALGDFREALALDPQNQFALQRVQDAVGTTAPLSSSVITRVSESQEIELVPGEGVRDFHFRGDTKGLLEAIAKGFGLRPLFDDSVQTKRIRFDVEGADFETTMDVAAKMSKTFWVPLSAKEIYFIADSPENRRQFERLSVQTFYLAEAATPQEINEVVSILRGLFDIRFISPQVSQSSIVVRAPQSTLRAARHLIENLAGGKPQVQLDVKVFEVNRSMLRSLGLDLPLEFNSFVVGSEILELLDDPNIQDLINDLIASGGINQANSASLSALLAQLQNQGSILGQPLLFFGGGATLSAVNIPALAANFNFNESRMQQLQHATLRAAHGTPANFQIGTRFPILNSTFAPIFNSRALRDVIRDNSFVAPFPSFTYEDLGLTMKTTPLVQGNDKVSLQFELKVRTLTGRAFNGVPIISNREYSGTITVPNGETGVVAGMMSMAEQKSLRGVPGLHHIPVIGDLTKRRGKESSETELLVLVTPHIVRLPQSESTEIRISNK
jgi:general secretion pathway protein D